MIQKVIIFLAIIYLLLLSGCDEIPQSVSIEKSKTDPVGKPENAGASETLLIDGFEDKSASQWGCDSAETEADLDYKSEGATQGKKALRLKLREPEENRGDRGVKILLRREVNFSFEGARAIILDADNAIMGAMVAVGFKGGKRGFYQESRPIKLTLGENNNIRIPLVGPTWKSASTNWRYLDPPVNLPEVNRLFVIVMTNGPAMGSVTIDNLRLETPADTFYREWRPEILFSSPLSDCEQFEKQEKMVFFRASYSNVFNSRDIAVGLKVITPSGQTLFMRGFFSGLAKGRISPTKQSQQVPLWGPQIQDSIQLPKSSSNNNSSTVNKNEELPGAEPVQPPAPPSSAFIRKKSDSNIPKMKKANSADSFEQKEFETAKNTNSIPVWKVRFTPQEAGRYRVQLYVRNRLGEARSEEESFLAMPARAKPNGSPMQGGGIRISPRDTRLFETGTGNVFLPLGQNVCWAKDFAPYFKRIKEYGGNVCRIWLCPWGLALEKPTVPGAYDLETADRIDRLVTAAENQGIRLIFCFTYHGITGNGWLQSPYAAENGGPCARPEDFFTHPRARAQFARLMRYAAARWGYSPSIFAWELMNEIDLVKADRSSDVADWALDLAGRLKFADPHRRLVTISVSKPYYNSHIWKDPRLDFIAVHTYGNGLSNRIYEGLAAFRSVPKPCWIMEFGGHWSPETDLADIKGKRLKDTLWLTACSPTAGIALPWWWDLQIEAHKLYPRFSAVQRFISREDRRGRFRSWIKKPLEATWEAVGILDHLGGRIFIHRLDPMADGPKLPETETLNLQGIQDGKFRVQFWDTETGKEFSSVEIEAKENKLHIPLPSRSDSFAIKFDHQFPVKPGIVD